MSERETAAKDKAAAKEAEAVMLPSEKLAQQDGTALAEALNKQVADRPDDHPDVIAENAMTEAEESREAIVPEAEEEAEAK